MGAPTNGPDDEEDGDGDDRWSPTANRPENGRKVAKSPPGVASSPTATIVAMARSGLVSKCWSRQRKAIWVVGLIGGSSPALKKASKVQVATENRRKYSFMGGERNGTGIGGGS